jgi:DedD protein
MRLPFLRPKASADTGVPAAATQVRRAREREASAPDPAAELTAVDAARVRARRRLVGALVLLAIAVVGFPALFDSQPRPLPIDTPMLLAAHDPAHAGTAPDAPPGLPSSPPPAALPSSLAPTTANTTAPASAPDAHAWAQRLAPPPEPVVEPAASAAEPVRPAHATASAAAVDTVPAGGMNGASTRFVVQVGAYSDAAALQLARSKVDKLGLKSYTQVIGDEAARRTRVRVGPFATRADAQAAADRIKRGGLPASILAL